MSVVVAEDSLGSFRFLWAVPHSQGFSSSSNDGGVSLPSSVTLVLSSSGPAAEGRRERGLLFEGRGDSWAKRCARVVGDGGAFGSRRREWRLGLRVGMISSREMWCATGTISSLRALLCIGDGMVESLVPLAVYAQNTSLGWRYVTDIPCTAAYRDQYASSLTSASPLIVDGKSFVPLSSSAPYEFQ